MTSLSDETFQAMMDWTPIFATVVGVPGWDDRLEDLSVDGQQARVAGNHVDEPKRGRVRSDRPEQRLLVAHHA